MATPQQDLLTVLVSGESGRPGRSYPFQLSGAPLTLARFPGAAQVAFLALGKTATNGFFYQIADLTEALSAAVAAGWLSLGSSSPGAGDGSTGVQRYVLEQAGFAEAGGTAPTQSASAQQLLNVAAALDDTPGAAQFDLNYLTPTFVGTGNTFAPEDVLPGYGYALAQGWVRPANGLNGSVFSLTAAGVAQAT
jgi:hypothetical protein